MSAWHRQAAHCLSSVSSVSASCRVCGPAAVTGCTYVRDAGTGRSTAGTKWNWPQTCHTQTCDNTPWCVSLYKKLRIHEERNHFLHVYSSVLPDWVSASQSDQKGEIWDREFSKHWFAYTNETSYNWWELIFFPLLWLSYNWVWTSSSGELIDLGLNSSLFSLENNYAVIGRAEENRWPPPPILHPSPLLPPVCYERNHFCCHLQSVPNNSLCFTEWEGGVRWKMSSSEVHEGVKLQTPLCPQPRASKGISSFIDRAAEFLVAAAAAVPTTSSSSLDCFCFQVTSYLLLQLFQFLRACCMKTEGIAISGSLGNVHKPQQGDNTKETHWRLLTFMLSGRHRSCQRPPTSPPPPDATSSNE